MNEKNELYIRLTGFTATQTLALQLFFIGHFFGEASELGLGWALSADSAEYKKKRASKKVGTVQVSAFAEIAKARDIPKRILAFLQTSGGKKAMGVAGVEDAFDFKIGSAGKVHKIEV